jgi:hypothetical protein
MMQQLPYKTQLSQKWLITGAATPCYHMWTWHEALSACQPAWCTYISCSLHVAGNHVEGRQVVYYDRLCMYVCRSAFTCLHACQL